MAKYLISFPSAAMVVPDGEWEAVGRDAHAVIDEAKAAGVYVFGGGIAGRHAGRRRSRCRCRANRPGARPHRTGKPARHGCEHGRDELLTLGARRTP